MERKCKVCGSPMNRTSNGYKCTFCAYEEGRNSDLSAYATTQPIAKNRQKKSPVVPIVIGVVLVVTVLLVIASVLPMMLASNIRTEEVSSNQEANLEIEEQLVNDNSQMADGDEEPEEATGMVGGVGKDGFRSYSMRLIVSQIFGKPLEDVTQEELESIRYLAVETSWIDETCTFSYSMADYRDYEPDYCEKIKQYSEETMFAYSEDFLDTVKTISVIYIDRNMEDLYEDLANFTNVNALRLDDFTYVDLEAFHNLSMVDCDGEEISELLEANISAEQIEVLKEPGDSLEGIWEFTSLKKLYLEGNDLAQLEDVAQCTTLDTLYCMNLSGYTSFAPIGALKDLKTLYIDGSSDGLKDLSVIASLTELENLTITDTDILNLDFVKGLEKLNTLRLSENDELRIFDGLAGLTNLTHLEFNINSLSGNQPEYAEIGELKNLKSLVLHTVYNLDFLYELNQLEKLEVRLTFYNDLLEPIRKMSHLQTLTIAQSHSQFDDGFACLSELPELKTLIIDKMEFDEPMDGLFTLDNLEELRITNSKFYVAPTQVAVGEHLKRLDLSFTEFITMPDYGEYMYVGYEDEAVAQGVLQSFFPATGLEELYLDYYFVSDLSGLNQMSNLKVLSLNRCDLTELPGTDLVGCPLLEELYLASNQISDISFVTNLPNLKRVDLEDCYVSDIVPLMECTELEYLNIRNNPIASDTIKDVNVLIK